MWLAGVVICSGFRLCAALQALVIPNVQSLTADYNSSNSRGTAFGFLWVTISVGGMLGTLFATNIG